MTMASAPSTSPVRRRWSLRRRLRLVLVVSALITVAFIAAAITLIAAVRGDENRVVNRYFKAVQVSTQLFTGLVDSETAIRGYALTGDQSTLSPFTEFTATSTLNQVKELQTVLKGDSAALAAQNKAEASAIKWYLQWALPTIAVVKSRGVGHVTAADVEKGKTLFDAIRNDFGRYTNLLLDRRRAASNSLIRRTDLLFITVIAAAAALVAAGTGLWFALRRWIVLPIQGLGSDARTVAGGALDHPVQTMGPEEIYQLGADVDAMRRRLVSQVSELELANQQTEESRDALARQATDLERSNRDLEQFAYVASHDLQEPLRKVASFCQMLEKRYKGQLDSRADEYIGFAVDGAKRMQQLISDLLEFSRVGRSAHPLQRVELGSSLQIALAQLETALTASGALVTADALPVVMGDEQLLVQLLQNLIANAIKFHGDGVPHIHLSAQRVSEGWEFACADDGIGIQPEYAERVFVIFQRLHPREAYEGTGIGLAMCKKIVEYHGGRIWLDSNVASGATFRWTLLADTTRQESPAGTGQLHQPASDGEWQTQ
jgi:signal transduction histidine kinase